MKKYYLLIVLLISGCETTPIVYNPDGVKPSQLASIATLHENSFMGSGFGAWIENVWNDKNVEFASGLSFFGKISNITLKAGSYKFKVLCANGSEYAHPEAKFNLVSGKKYQIYCEIKRGNSVFGEPAKDFAKINIKEI